MVRSLLTNGGYVENARDYSYISLSVQRSSSKSLTIPISFVPPTTLIGYRWACLRTKYTDYLIKPLNCPWLSYPLVRYIYDSHLVRLLSLEGSARPNFRGFAWGGLTYDTLRLYKFRLSPSRVGSLFCLFLPRLLD